MNPKHTPKPTTIKEGPALISNSEIGVPYSLAESVAMYFVVCAEQTKYWQEKRRSFDRHILPALGEATLVGAITSEQLADVISSRRVQGHADAARVLHITLNQYSVVRGCRCGERAWLDCDANKALSDLWVRLVGASMADARGV
ncbi:hypothetical protein [Hyphomicrobium sp. NDB2Meth4]|uniref:hypothetical protein n=1 Tax=Hyphomicrobium sp. NDB2Meth4 TaxID=1892846 RepID=UPI0009317691|nr:hypothetical protein [Hyphomicrobium sp. NDB2Meth4]